jgi:phosphoribosylanthranilate isomerase
MRPRVKICCVHDLAEAQAAIAAGADALGFVGAMPSGPGIIPDEAIRDIVAEIPPPIATFLLTAEVEAEAIAALVRFTGCNTVQLCAATTAAERGRLRRACPWVRVVPVVHVNGPEALDDAREAAEHAHALLLDSGKPQAAVPKLGGTGEVHDWSVSARIVAESAVPVWLAGGLNAENVGEAIRRVRPFGLDLCSGVRDGAARARLVPDKLGAFMAAVAAC